MMHRPLVLFLVALGLAACTPQVAHRGYIPKSQSVQSLKKGMTREQTRSLLGSPSTTGGLERGISADYYISSTTETTAIMGTKEVDRTVMVLKFTPQNHLETIASYGFENGKIVNFSDRETPTSDHERSLLMQIFGNLTANPLPTN